MARAYGPGVVAFLLAILIGGAAAAPVDSQGRPLIRKLGTIDCDLVETTPVVFRGKLYRCEWVRTSYEGNELGENYSRLVDVRTGEPTAPFARGYVFSSAFVDGDTVYVTGTSTEQGWTGRRVEMFASKDLKRWRNWTALDLDGFGICNTSICKAADKYVMMFEIHKPREQAGTAFTARFATSKDLRTWKLTAPECVYAKDRYSAPHCLRYLDGYFYDFYLEAHDGYEMRVVRSRDLIHWEPSPLNPVLKASPEDKQIANEKLTTEQRRRIAEARNINNSDIDFCQYDGRLIINYSWGNQQGKEFLAEAVYDGTVEEFLRGWFPPGRSRPETEGTKGGEPSTLLEKARGRVGDLRFGCYATSRQVEQMATDADFRARAWDVVERMGITKVYLEVYRGGHVVSPERLVFVRDWLAQRDIAVAGGIATVPGADVGVRQQGALGWFNWQNAKTQRDLERIMRMAAPIFDTFIVDDFLCTGDVSAESKRAKGSRSWGQYRRALLTELARSIFVGPAKEVNPDITMIVKYPQWYDRFHLFGYDTETFPRIFDRVWVGTETRGRNTQRFGFVQPYEGFVNYRWLAGIAGGKIGGAWFDHGDCGEHDFLDQAYTSVLAGAPELVFFNLGNVMAGHPDHEKVAAQFDRLADLAAFVRKHPVVGVPAYKPPNSDPAGDMYLMDFLGMLGIPLVPVHEFPDDAPMVFLPAQAAADPDLPARMKKAWANGTSVVVTTNLLLALPNPRKLARRLGVDPQLKSSPLRAVLETSVPGSQARTAVDLEAPIEAESGDVTCRADGKKLVLLRTVAKPEKRLSLLNTHTYSQADFDAVGEVLLCPRPLGLLSIGGGALSALRAVFRGADAPIFAGPAGVTYHPFADAGQGGCVVQNFNDADADVTITVPLAPGKHLRFTDRFSGRPIASRPDTSQDTVVLRFRIPARGRVWVHPAEEGRAR